MCLQWLKVPMAFAAHIPQKNVADFMVRNIPRYCGDVYSVTMMIETVMLHAKLKPCMSSLINT